MSIRPAYIGLIFYFFLLSCSQPEEKMDCDRFRTGTFIHKERIPDSTIFINRGDVIQTERDSKKSFIIRDSVVWKNSCEYDLYFLSREPLYPPGMSEERKAFYDELRKKPMHVKIIKTGADYYVFEARKAGLDFVYTDTMRLMK